jgi:hypothetical protein
MKTLQLFSAKPETIPASASWYIADLAEARGEFTLADLERACPENVHFVNCIDNMFHSV